MSITLFEAVITDRLPEVAETSRAPMPHLSICEPLTRLFPPGWTPAGTAGEAADRRRHLAPAVLMEAVHLPTVKRRALQRSRAFQLAADAITAAHPTAPDQRWYDLQTAACTALAHTFTGEARWLDLPDHQRPMFTPGGPDLSHRFAKIASAYAWSTHHLNHARTGATNPASALRTAASRLDCATRHR